MPEYEPMFLLTGSITRDGQEHPITPREFDPRTENALGELLSEWDVPGSRVQALALQITRRGAPCPPKKKRSRPAKAAPSLLGSPGTSS